MRPELNTASPLSLIEKLITAQLSNLIPKADLLRTPYHFLFVLLLLPLGSGCAWFRGFVPVSGPQAPVVLSDQANLDQIMAAVNMNTARVQTYNSSAARISTPGLPALRANIAAAGSQQFRLKADTVLTGTEVDLGSNNQEFWFWMKRSQPPALYYSSHQAFAESQVRSVLPIEPTWLVEALGMATFTADAQHSGPRLIRPGQLEVRSDIQRPSGNMVKVTVVDSTRAWILEQHVYNSRGERLASAVAKNHRFDPTTGVSLPTQVDVQIPQAQLNLSIDVSDYQINRMVGDPNLMFARPNYDGVPAVDLSTLQAPTPVPVIRTNPTPAGLPVTRLPYSPPRY